MQYEQNKTGHYHIMFIENAQLYKYELSRSSWSGKICDLYDATWPSPI